MGCNVCIGGEPDGYCEFWNQETPTARKLHKCAECNREIKIGEKYERVSGKFDGDFFSETSCAECAEIRQKFACEDGAEPIGNLWWAMRDYAFPNLTTASECFTMLSPRAKQFCLDKWNEWKFARRAQPDAVKEKP